MNLNFSRKRLYLHLSGLELLPILAPSAAPITTPKGPNTAPKVPPITPPATAFSTFAALRLVTERGALLTPFSALTDFVLLVPLARLQGIQAG
jgi:hypothetical protein